MTTTFTRYGNLVIRDYLGEPALEELAALEKLIATPLPGSFKAFLKVANGGSLDGYFVEVAHPDQKITRSFSILYGTRRRMESSPFGLFEHEIALSREAAQLPTEVLPIARDSTGCELYLDLTDYAETGQDRVVAFINGIPDIEDQPENNAWVTLALSFEDYLNQLRLDEEHYLEILQDMQAGDDDERAARRAEVVDFLELALPHWRDDSRFAPFRDLRGSVRH